MFTIQRFLQRQTNAHHVHNMHNVMNAISLVRHFLYIRRRPVTTRRQEVFNDVEPPRCDAGE